MFYYVYMDRVKSFIKNYVIVQPTKNTKFTKKEKKMSELIFKEESYVIMRACFNVYKTMGCGFL